MKKTILSFGAIGVLLWIAFNVCYGFHSMDFQNNSGKTIPLITVKTRFKNMEYKNVKPTEFLHFNFFSIYGKAEVFIQTDSIAITENIDLDQDIFFDYYHQMQVFTDDVFSCGELYIFDEKLMPNLK